MTDLETRFAHLLQPIRDLAANWHIDVAAELEDYLHDLDQIDINMDADTMAQLGLSDDMPNSQSSSQSIYSLNFAEAALLIQGSACVYSKKVEYLYSLLFQTLDRLIENKQKRAKQKENSEQSNSQSNSQSLNQTIDEFAEEEMLPLDDLLESTQCDLDEQFIDQSSYDQARRSTLIVRMPAALAVKHSSDQSNNQSSSQSNGQSSQEEKQFRISECFVHSSGALLLERRDAALIESFNQSNNQIPIQPLFGNPVTMIKAHRQSLGLLNSQSENQSVERGIDFSDVDDDHQPFDQNNECDPEMKYNDEVADWDQIINPDNQSNNQSNNQQSNQLMKQPVKSILRTVDDDHLSKNVQFASDQSLCDYQSINQSLYEPVDYYALLDPLDATTKGKPFRKGKCYRTFKKDESNDQSNDQAIKQTINVSSIADPAYQAIMHEINNQSIKAPYSTEFAYIYLQTINQRKKLQSRKRKERESSIITNPTIHQSVNQSTNQSNNQPIIEPENDLIGFDDDDHEDFIVDNQSNDQPNAWEATEAAPLDTSLDQINQSIDQSTASYESLCRQYLDAYLKEADSMLESSELSERVKKWNDQLIVCLDDQDSRPEFDIHVYEDKILESLQSINLSNDDSIDQSNEQPKPLSEQSIVQFEDAVSGAPVYEICRLFLATLQLANNGNVLIERSVIKGHERSINQSNNQTDDQDEEREAEWGSLALKVLSTEQKIPVRFNQPINQSNDNSISIDESDVFDEMLEQPIKRTNNQSNNQSSDEDDEENYDDRDEKRKSKLKKRSGRVALKDQSNKQSIKQSDDVTKPVSRKRKGKRNNQEVD